MTTKPLAEWAPFEVDTRLAELSEQYEMASLGLNRARTTIWYTAKAKKIGWTSNAKWNMTFEEALAVVEANTSSGEVWTSRDATKALEGLGAAMAKVAEVVALMAPLNAEYRRRPWTRVFLAVESTTPHAHKGMDCSTCNKMGKPTKFGWLPQYSGRPESEIVEDAGERACTTCYPTAPVSVLSRPTKMFTAEELDKAKAREEREAKRAKAAAEKVVVEGIVEWKYPTTKEFKTLRAATQFASSARADILWWGADHPTASQWDSNASAVEKAIAAKTGQSLAEVKADIEKRSQATLKRRKAGR